jgi:predicted DNA-binding transcriptional regulator AlpA
MLSVNSEMMLMMPNPSDWLDTNQTAEVLGRSRATVYDMVDRGVLTRYQIGGLSVYWLAEVREVAAALRRLEVRGHGVGNTAS